MNELELITALANLGGTVVVVAIFAWLASSWNNAWSKERQSSEKRYDALAGAIVHMYESIDTFNQKNGRNQDTCNFIREALSAESGKIEQTGSLLVDIATRLEKLSKAD